ncbi:hypothetical protein BgAZ_108270 [Babesia gibsoni]|uniref:Uncharacterized protein n=1 Tax=Babesia gibsoni TaxID=33632 RepID=A0AAD8PGF6_BABGI|nr:hypothetical protein BgAZ_108270 [Babesia gibsoni]
MDDSGDDAVTACAVRDTGLLEESLCDLIVAFGGTADLTNGFCLNRSDFVSHTEYLNSCFNHDRMRHLRRAFYGLDVTVPAFFRVLHLHLKRGATLLNKCPSFLKDETFMPQTEDVKTVDTNKDKLVPKSAVIPSNESAAEPAEAQNIATDATVTDESTTDNASHVPQIKVFCHWYVDSILTLYDEVVKHVCTLDIYDYVRVRCFLVNLDQILVDNSIGHIKLRNAIYELMLKLLSFSLQDAWWMYTDIEWVGSKLPFIFDVKWKSDQNGLDIEEVKSSVNRVGAISGQRGKVDVSLFGDIMRIFDLTKGEDDMWEQLMGPMPTDPAKFDEFVLFKKATGVRPNNWVDVLTVSLVEIVYCVMFESFIRQLDIGNKRVEVHGILERLETLGSLLDMLHEIDVGYTAWAVDVLGNRVDPTLVNAFHVHGESLLNGEDDVSDSSAVTRMKWGEGIHVFNGILHRINRMFYDLVLSIVDRISKPALEEIDKFWGSKLWWELTHSKDKLLIGPKGTVNDMIRICSKRVRFSVCVELFSRVIAHFAKKVYNGKVDSEHMIFDALAIWDSFCAINNVTSQYQNKNYHINRLFHMVEEIKMGRFIDGDEPLICAKDFWSPLFSLPQKKDSKTNYSKLSLSHYIHQELKGTVSLDHTVWARGLIKMTMALFGNVLFIFRDYSSLQPVGIVDTEDLVAIVSPCNNKKRSTALDSLESDLDLYSCGTTESESSIDGPPHAPSSNSHIDPDEPVSYWGWRMRLEVVGGAYDSKRGKRVTEVADNNEEIEFEFMGPEHRERWSRSLKSILNSGSHTPNKIWWRCYSMFLQ